MRVALPMPNPGYTGGGNDALGYATQWPQWNIGVGAGAPWSGGTQRTPYRHGGGVPWAKTFEGPRTTGTLVNGGFPGTFEYLTGAIPAPVAADAHYLTEKIGTAAESSTIAAGAIGSGLVGAVNVTGGNDLTFQPNATAVNFMAAPASPNGTLLATMFAHPGKPVLGVTIQNHGPTGEATLGIATELGLVRAGITVLNVETLGAQVRYIFRIAGLGYTVGIGGNAGPGAAGPPANKNHSQYPMAWNGIAWTADDANDSLGPLSGAGDYRMTAHCNGGWTYSATVDPTTGAILTIVPVTEPSVITSSVLDEFVNSRGGEPRAHAMVWGGMRQILARPDLAAPFAVIGGGPIAAGILRWRLAQPWRTVMHLRRRGWLFGFPPLNDWTFGVGAGMLNGFLHPLDFVSPDPAGGFPPGVGCPLQLFRGLRARDSVAVSGGWNTLATFAFPAVGNVQATGVPGATLPAIGDEILISGQSGFTFTGGFPPLIPPQHLPINFVLYPEASPVAIAVPIAHGGVLQGGRP